MTPFKSRRQQTYARRRKLLATEVRIIKRRDVDHTLGQMVRNMRENLLPSSKQSRLNWRKMTEGNNSKQFGEIKPKRYMLFVYY